jgi:hypothetical protein
MYDPDCSLWATHLTLMGVGPSPLALLAYVGLNPGDLLPYFAALLGVAGAAFVALVQLPIMVLRGWLKAKRERRDAPETQSLTAEQGEPG